MVLKCNKHFNELTIILIEEINLFHNINFGFNKTFACIEKKDTLKLVCTLFWKVLCPGSYRFYCSSSFCRDFLIFLVGLQSVFTFARLLDKFR
jgi:hypothetical protein